MKVPTPIFAIALSMLAVGAVSAFREREGRTDSQRASRQKLEYELSLMNLQQDFESRHLGVEERRMEMSRWTEARFGGEEKNATNVATPSHVFVDPGQPPARQGKSAAQFVAEVKGYHADLDGFVTSTAKRSGDLEWGRNELARRMEEPSLLAMEESFRLARAELAAVRVNEESPPLSGDQLASLSGSEKVEEEIYAAVHAVTRKPFSPGDELRDRLAPLDEWIQQKRKTYAEERRNEARSLWNQRKASLEAQLEELSPRIEK